MFNCRGLWIKDLMLLTIHQGKIVSNHHLALLNHPASIKRVLLPSSANMNEFTQYNHDLHC
ncbi:hypothetical protein CXF80_16710 [Shewanella sp. Actino-trap-3]|uniref:Uncharacterized protein n=1 Tax=Shewanella psychromarinicola TaxID=2487742 RepID=A0A3N4E5H5_9GAMM|nr:hypothetical protein CXF80_16710 [Shewanella sp. Actino-trap-3]RPA33333.1 hypothetical protein EGC77_08325 [Shewanella psychromarinicola]